MSCEIPERLPAPFFDSAVPGMAHAFVSQIHLNIDVAGKLDEDRLAEAVRLLVDAEPVLGCLFAPRLFRPHWRRLPARDIDATDLLRVETEYASSAEKAFLGESLDPRIEPPVKFALIRNRTQDRLIVKVDHQASDAAGLKHLAYTLADIYGRLEKHPDYRPEPNKMLRGYGDVYKPFIPSRLPGIARRWLRDLKTVFWPMVNLTFPAGRQMAGSPVFVSRCFAGDKFRSISNFASQKGGTVNDLANAAMIRALARTADWDGHKALRLIGTVDLRRYLPDPAPNEVSNRSGWYFLNLGRELGSDLAETFAKVKSQVDFLKSDYMGLGFNLFAYLLLLPLPYFLRVPHMKLNTMTLVAFGNMAPTLTNMGRIDPRRLDFGHLETTSAHLMVPPGVPPVMTLGLSGFKDSMTLSCGFFESAVPKEKIVELFDCFEEELP